MISVYFRAMTTDYQAGYQAILEIIQARLASLGLPNLIGTDPVTGQLSVPACQILPVASIAPALQAINPALPITGTLRVDVMQLPLTGAPFQDLIDGVMQETARHVAMGINVHVTAYNNAALESGMGGLLTGAFSAGQTVPNGKRVSRAGKPDVDWVVGGPAVPKLKLV